MSEVPLCSLETALGLPCPSKCPSKSGDCLPLRQVRRHPALYIDLDDLYHRALGMGLL